MATPKTPEGFTKLKVTAVEAVPAPTHVYRCNRCEFTNSDIEQAKAHADNPVIHPPGDQTWEAYVAKRRKEQEAEAKRTGTTAAPAPAVVPPAAPAGAK